MRNHDRGEGKSFALAESSSFYEKNSRQVCCTFRWQL
jgi:hypothetical protein